MSDDKPSKPRGYGKPPVEYQFPKKTSGNPRGRPPKPVRALTPRQVRRDIFDAMEATTRVRTAKGDRKVAAIEAIYKRLIQKAISGHGPSMRLALTLYEKACIEHSKLHERGFSFSEFVEFEMVTKVEDPGPIARSQIVNHLRKKTRRY